MKKLSKSQLPKFYNKEIMDQIIEDYLVKKLSTGDIIKKYKTSRSTLNRNLVFHKIPVREKNKQISLSKNAKIQYNYFKDLNNPEVQYWLGFLSADGCIFEDRITLGLALKDKDAIEKFNKFLGNNLTIKNVLHYDKYPQVQISFRNKTIVEFLKEIGITSKKSLTINYKLPITWDFLRGYIDGDGCISITEKRIRVELISGSKLLINKISKFLEENNIKFGQYEVSKNRKNSYYTIQVFKHSSVEFIIENLYKNACVFLNRKYNNAAKIRNYFVHKRLNSGNQH